MSARKTARRTKAKSKSRGGSPKRKPTKLAAVKARRKAPSRSRSAPARKAAARKPAARKPATRPKAPATRRVQAKKSTRKAAPKAAAAAKTPRKAARRPEVVRRDGAGHLDPKYAATLRERSSERPKDNDRVFFDGSRSSDDLAEELGEEVVEKMTSGEDEGEDVLDQRVSEEDGGPFVETSAKTEFGYDTDKSNPKGAKREPFPTT